jgi:hypothetical protein
MPVYRDHGNSSFPMQHTVGQVRASRRVPAVRIVATADGASELGGFAHIEADSLLSLCGEGYNDQTVKVRLENEYFYVFRADLLSARDGDGGQQKRSL